ncbi:MAG: type II secretion system protein [Dehalococcoidales bacterium]|nr:type II secretion system protein [Dehalococcoidales bacterium]
MKSQKGFTLIETLVGMFILVLIGVTLLASLTLSSKILVQTDSSETARDLAVAEMEYLINLPYADSYSHDESLVPGGSNFTITIDTPVSIEEDGNLQKLTVRIWLNGQEITCLEDYKVNWQ